MIEGLRLPFGFSVFTPPSSLMFGFCSVRKPERNRYEGGELIKTRCKNKNRGRGAREKNEIVKLSNNGRFHA